MTKTKKQKPNTTPDGRPACMYGTYILDDHTDCCEAVTTIHIRRYRAKLLVAAYYKKHPKAPKPPARRK